MKENTEALLVTTKEIGLKVNADKTTSKYMVMCRDRNAGRGHSVKIDNSSIERVEEFRTTLTDQNLIQEEIKSRLKLGNACYYSVHNLLPSRLLSKNLKIKIYKTIILPVVLYGCETWSLTLREACRLRLFENSVLRRIFGPKRDEVTGEWRKPNIVRVIKSRRIGWAGHVACLGKRRGVYRVLVGKREEKRPLGIPRRRWGDNIKIDVQEVGCGGMDSSYLVQDRDS